MLPHLSAANALFQQDHHAELNTTLGDIEIARIYIKDMTPQALIP